MSYLVRVVASEIHAWNNQDGQGEYLMSKGGYPVGRYETLDDAKIAIEDDCGCSMEDADIQDEFISMSRIEDENAYGDPNGRYLVDYTYVIEETNLVKLFG